MLSLHTDDNTSITRSNLWLFEVHSTVTLEEKENGTKETIFEDGNLAQKFENMSMYM